MIKVAIVGASGYSGAQLVNILSKHPKVQISGLYVSDKSADAGKKITQLYGFLAPCDYILEPLVDVASVALKSDVVFLATDHKVAHDLSPIFLKHNCTVFDLSGAHRVKEKSFYPKYYGFEHEHFDLVLNSVYGLYEFLDKKELDKCNLISMPGCYPTASELALKPIVLENMLDKSFKPIINATSGVSGAGRKASLKSSFCEVSLQAYNLFAHRHTPEIAYHVGHEVIFNPHLGSFYRGILATISLKLNKHYNLDDIYEVYYKYYKNALRVILKHEPVSLLDVVNTKNCAISLHENDGYLVICSAIDNLLKGAASQACDVMDLKFNLKE